MILALGARGREFDSRITPFFFLFSFFFFGPWTSKKKNKQTKKKKKKKKKSGGAGYRSLCLMHAKHALYHLSYTPNTNIITARLTQSVE
jgi:hypothetical protein